MEIKSLFKVATNPNHLLHPFGNIKKGQEKISTGKRILGIALFTLSFATAGILPALYLYTAYRKISRNPKTPSSQKTSHIANATFDSKKAKKNDPYFVAIENGDLKAIQDGMSSKKITANAYSSQGFPLLTYAIHKKQQEIIDFLLEQPDLKIDDPRFNFSGDVKQTALHEAVMQDNSDMTRKLLEKGYSPNIIDAYGRTPVHYAIHNCNLDMFKLFIANDKVDLQVKDTQEGGYTPFLFAIERKYFEIVEELINTKKDEINFTDKDFYGNNLFHLLFDLSNNVVVKKNGAELLKLLLETCPEAIKKQLLSEKNENNKLPIELAKEALQNYLNFVDQDMTPELQKRYDNVAEYLDRLDPSI